MARLFLAAGCLFSMGLCVAGLQALQGERAALGVPNAQSDAFLLYAANNNISFGASDYSKRLLLSDCNDAAIRMLGDFNIAIKPDAVATRSNCLLVAQKIVENSPINAFAWAVQARLFAANLKLPEFRSSLMESYHGGPFSLLAAKARVDLSRIYSGYLDDETRRLRDTDLLMLGRVRDGSLWLAEVYAKDSEFRPTIIAAFEPLPAEDKAKFLRYARKQMETIGAGT